MLTGPLPLYDMLSLKFPVTMATRDISKLPKITILRWFFTSKFISKCCNFSMDWGRVKGFSALVTHYLTIDLRSYLAFHKSKIFLASEVFDRGWRRKNDHFLSNISQTKNSAWGLNMVIFHCLSFYPMSILRKMAIFIETSSNKFL
jgi:hypothetical protein